MKKTIFCLLLSISILGGMLPHSFVSAAEEWKTTIASEPVAYTHGDLLLNHRSDYNAEGAWVGGTGWNGGWYPGFGYPAGDKPSIVYRSAEELSYLSNYKADVSLNRKLASPIDTATDGEYLISFAYHETGASDAKLLTLNDKVGFGDSGVKPTQNTSPTLYAGFYHEGDTDANNNFRLQLEMDGKRVTDDTSHTFAAMQQNGKAWLFKLSLSINASGDDTLRMKAWLKGTAEPSAWMLSVSSELAGKTLDMMDIRNNGTGICVADIKIEKINIAYQNATKAIYESLESVTDAEEKAARVARLTEKGFFYEDFNSYAVNDALWNHRSDYDADTAWTDGVGWTGGWRSKIGAPSADTPKIVSETFHGEKQNFLRNYAAATSINRRITNPVNTMADGEYYLSFLYSDAGNSKNPIVVDTKIGLSDNSASLTKDTPPGLYGGICYDEERDAYFVQLGSGSQKQLGDASYSWNEIGGQIFQFKLRISVKESNTDTLSLKVWNSTEQEPADWTIVMDTELSGQILDLIDFRNNTTTAKLGALYMESYEPAALRDLYERVDTVSAENYDAVSAVIGQFDAGLAKEDLLAKLAARAPKELTEVSFRFKDGNGTAIERIMGGETSVLAEWKIKNTLGTDKKVTALLAVYENERLKTIKIEEVTLKNDDETLVEVGFESLEEVLLGDETVKAFLWEFGSLKPVFESRSINGSGLNNPDSPNRLFLFVDSGAEKEGDGSVALPFSSIAAARDYIREYKVNHGYPKDGICVYLRGGTYSLDSTLAFESRDGGTEDAPVVYRSYPGEQAVLAGGQTFRLETDFKPVTSADGADRIDSSVRDKVKYLDLRDYGITEYGQLPITGHAVAYYTSADGVYPSQQPFSLSFDNQTMQLARWPNEGYTTISEVVDAGSMEDKRGFTIAMADKERLAKWQTADDVYLHGYWYWNWSDLAVKVSSIDAAQGRITGDNPSPSGVRKGQRFYVYNVLEELDSPGEWYLDRTTGRLYFYPPSETGEVLLSSLQTPIIQATNAQYLSFEDIKMTGGCGKGIEVNGGVGVVVNNCEVGNTFLQGVSLTNCTNCGITNSHIYQNGAGGIGVSGGSTTTLAPGGNIISGNSIHDYALEKRSYSAAVRLGGVGNTVSGNRIYNAPHLAIHFSGNDHEISDNEIYNVLQEADDSGAVYSMRLKTNRGTRIVNNYFHDISSGISGTSHGVYCVYLDDMLDGTTVARNVFANITGDAVMINGGRDNQVTDNICVDVSKSVVRLTAVGTNPNYGYAVNDKFLANSDLASGRHLTEPYAKYTHLANILDDDPLRAKYNIVKRNVCCRSGDIRYTDYAGTTLDEIAVNNDISPSFVTDTDPGFTDAASGDFSLRNDSVVYETFPDFAGFKK